jgi:glucose 1-dehydrogenase
MSLDGKVACVTGGNGGIGRAIVMALAKAGAKVVIDYVANPDATEELEQKIAALGERAVGVEADVSKVPDLQKLVDSAVQKLGRLDIMVNNAGIETRTSVLDTTEEQYDKVLDINLKSAFFGTQVAARQMIAQGGGGRIINITSVHEDWPMPGNTAYCLSKGGMRMLTRTAGVELGPKNILVVGVGPGAAATPHQLLDDGGPGEDEDPRGCDPTWPHGAARGDSGRRGLPGRGRCQLPDGHDDIRRRRHHAGQPGTLNDPEVRSRPETGRPGAAAGPKEPGRRAAGGASI